VTVLWVQTTRGRIAPGPAPQTTLEEGMTAGELRADLAEFNDDESPLALVPDSEIVADLP